MNNQIAKKYTKALLGALKESEVAGALKSLESLSKNFADKDFCGIINTPTLKGAKKLEFLLGIVKIKDKKLLNFLKALSDKNRLNEIPNIASELNRHIRQKSNEYELLVQSSFALDSKDLASIKANLEQRLGISLYATHKKSTIEGIRLYIDGMGVESAFLKQSFSSGMKNHILKAFN